MLKINYLFVTEARVICNNHYNYDQMKALITQATTI
jgi:hypothetical protein